MAEKKVLIVEDDFYIRKMFMRGFLLAGYEVEGAEEVDTAFAKLRAQTFDAMLLDIMLPNVSGIEILKMIRQGNEPFKNIPIFVVTNRLDEKVHQDAVSLGVAGYFTKSQHDPQDIVKAVKSYFTTPQVH